MSDYLPLPKDSGAMHQVIFALQCRMAVVAHDMLRDYVEGGYKQVGDNAKKHSRDMIGFQPSLPSAIWHDLLPLLRGAEIPWYEVMTNDWADKPPTDDGSF
jgi:hypothetical protein